MHNIHFNFRLLSEARCCYLGFGNSQRISYNPLAPEDIDHPCYTCDSPCPRSCEPRELHNGCEQIQAQCPSCTNEYVPPEIEQWQRADKGLLYPHEIQQFVQGSLDIHPALQQHMNAKRRQVLSVLPPPPPTMIGSGRCRRRNPAHKEWMCQKAALERIPYKGKLRTRHLPGGRRFWQEFNGTEWCYVDGSDNPEYGRMQQTRTMLNRLKSEELQRRKSEVERYDIQAFRTSTEGLNHFYVQRNYAQVSAPIQQYPSLQSRAYESQGGYIDRTSGQLEARFYANNPQYNWMKPVTYSENQNNRYLNQYQPLSQNVDSRVYMYGALLPNVPQASRIGLTSEQAAVQQYQMLSGLLNGNVTQRSVRDAPYTYYSPPDTVPPPFGMGVHEDIAAPIYSSSVYQGRPVLQYSQPRITDSIDDAPYDRILNDIKNKLVSSISAPGAGATEYAVAMGGKKIPPEAITIKDGRLFIGTKGQIEVEVQVFKNPNTGEYRDFHATIIDHTNLNNSVQTTDNAPNMYGRIARTWASESVQNAENNTSNSEVIQPKNEYLQASKLLKFQVNSARLTLKTAFEELVIDGGMGRPDTPALEHFSQYELPALRKQLQQVVSIYKALPRQSMLYSAEDLTVINQARALNKEYYSTIAAMPDVLPFADLPLSQHNVPSLGRLIQSIIALSPHAHSSELVKRLESYRQYLQSQCTPAQPNLCLGQTPLCNPACTKTVVSGTVVPHTAIALPPNLGPSVVVEDFDDTEQIPPGAAEPESGNPPDLELNAPLNMPDENPPSASDLKPGQTTPGFVRPEKTVEAELPAPVQDVADKTPEELTLEPPVVAKEPPGGFEYSDAIRERYSKFLEGIPRYQRWSQEEREFLKTASDAQVNAYRDYEKLTLFRGFFKGERPIHQHAMVESTIQNLHSNEAKKIVANLFYEALKNENFVVLGISTPLTEKVVQMYARLPKLQYLDLQNFDRVADQKAILTALSQAPALQDVTINSYTSITPALLALNNSNVQTLRLNGIKAVDQQVVDIIKRLNVPNITIDFDITTEEIRTNREQFVPALQALPNVKVDDGTYTIESDEQSNSPEAVPAPSGEKQNGDAQELPVPVQDAIKEADPLELEDGEQPVDPAFNRSSDATSSVPSSTPSTSEAVATPENTEQLRSITEFRENNQRTSEYLKNLLDDLHEARQTDDIYTILGALPADQILKISTAVATHVQNLHGEQSLYTQDILNSNLDFKTRNTMIAEEIQLYSKAELPFRLVAALKQRPTDDELNKLNTALQRSPAEIQANLRSKVQMFEPEGYSLVLSENEGTLQIRIIDTPDKIAKNK